MEGPTWPTTPFTTADLPGLGIAEPDVRRGLLLGEVRRIVRGVFVVSGLPETLELRVAAVAAALPPHQVVADRTAAWLHGVDAHTFGDHDTGVLVEMCALRWQAPSSLPGVAGRTRDLGPDDVMTLGGVLVTTPLRTALDLGCCLRRREAFAAMTMLARGHGFDVADLLGQLGRYRRRRGVVQLRELVSLVDPRLESPREAWVYLAIADAGIPLPEPQFWVTVDGVPTYRLDFAYPRLRVCVEYDGVEAHGSTPEQRERDETRRGWLRDHGWTVIVVRHGDFSDNQLERWLGELRRALQPTYSNRRW